MAKYKHQPANQLWYLEISSWVGVSLGATHFYGQISSRKDGKKTEFRLEHPISQKEATALNKADRVLGLSGTLWKRGSMHAGFATEDKVRDAGIARFCTEDLRGVLLEGRQSAIDPMPMLVGPSELCEEVNKLVAAAEANGWWEGRDEDGNQRSSVLSNKEAEAAMQEISDRYWKLMNSYGFDWKEKT